MTIDPQFDPTAAGITAAVLMHGVLIRPVRARRKLRRLEHAGLAEAGHAERWHWQTVGYKITWCMLTVAAVVATPGLDWADIGVTWPHGDTVGFAYGLAAVVALTAGGGYLVALRWPDLRRPAPPHLRPLLPRTRSSRRSAAAAVLAAGVGEEAAFRGLLIAAGAALGLPLAWAAALAGVMFVAGHLPVGGRAALSTALPTSAITVIYLAGGSLLLPIAVHIVADLVASFTPQPVQRRQPTPTEGMGVPTHPETPSLSDPVPHRAPK